MKTKLVSLFILLCFASEAQITSAKIVFERKTNLYKRFKDENDVSRWIKEEDKIKTDFFELYVNDTCSLFQPQESDLREQYSWATTKNTVYQNFNQGSSFLVKTMWGEELQMTDTIRVRKWNVSESTRKIAGYTCRKAVWRANDSTRIYAWFSYDIVPSSGPESFNGLPGTILGLATEDGSVVYFAKKVEVTQHEANLLVPKRKKKVYTVPELKARLTKEYGHEKWFNRSMNYNFGVW